MTKAAMPSTNSSLIYFPITPDDDNDLERATREIIVQNGGDVKVRRMDNVDVILPLPAGRHALVIRRLFATDTDATGFTAVI